MSKREDVGSIMASLEARLAKERQDLETEKEELLHEVVKVFHDFGDECIAAGDVLPYKKSKQAKRLRVIVNKLLDLGYRFGRNKAL